MLMGVNTFEPLQRQHWPCILTCGRIRQLILFDLVYAIMIVIMIIVLGPFLDEIKNFSCLSILLFSHLFRSVPDCNLFNKVVFWTLEEIRSSEIFVSR
jgi:hypothetical protein